MAEDCCLFDALSAVICMIIFSSVDNGVTDDHSETSDFIVRFYSFMFSEIFFNMNSLPKDMVESNYDEHCSSFILS